MHAPTAAHGKAYSIFRTQRNAEHETPTGRNKHETPHGDRSALVRPEDFAKLPLHEVLVSVLLRARAHSAVKVLKAGAVSVWDVVRLPVWVFMCDPVTRKQPILIEQELSRASRALPSVQPASSQRRNAYFRLAATPVLPLGRSPAACCVIALPCFICTCP